MVRPVITPAGEAVWVMDNGAPIPLDALPQTFLPDGQSALVDISTLPVQFQQDGVAIYTGVASVDAVQQYLQSGVVAQGLRPMVPSPAVLDEGVLAEMEGAAAANGEARGFFGRAGGFVDRRVAGVKSFFAGGGGGGDGAMAAEKWTGTAIKAVTIGGVVAITAQVVASAFQPVRCAFSTTPLSGGAILVQAADCSTCVYQNGQCTQSSGAPKGLLGQTQDLVVYGAIAIGALMVVYFLGRKL